MSFAEPNPDWASFVLESESGHDMNQASTRS
jgi:hypothetical protein